MAGNDEYTKLLLHMDGANGSTVFTDSSSSSKTVTRVGDAQISTAQSKFGGAAGLFDGTGDYITIPDHTDWDITGDTTDYTIDFWVKHSALGGSQIWASQVEPAAADGWFLYLTGGTVTFQVYSGGAGIISLTGGTIADNDWHHIALVKESTTYTFYKDGVSTGSVVDSSTDTFSALLQIGAYTDGNAPLNGYMDEFRWSKGIARWTEAFDPPDSAYSNYKITGVLNDAARLIAIEESSWTIVANAVFPAGSYEIGTASGTHLLLARREVDGEVVSYGDVESVT